MILQISVFFLPINNGLAVLCDIKECCFEKTVVVSEEKGIILFLWNTRSKIALDNLKMCNNWRRGRITVSLYLGTLLYLCVFSIFTLGLSSKNSFIVGVFWKIHSGFFLFWIKYFGKSPHVCRTWSGETWSFPFSFTVALFSGCSINTSLWH